MDMMTYAQAVQILSRKVEGDRRAALDTVIDYIESWLTVDDANGWSGLESWLEDVDWSDEPDYRDLARSVDQTVLSEIDTFG